MPPFYSFQILLSLLLLLVATFGKFRKDIKIKKATKSIWKYQKVSQDAEKELPFFLMSRYKVLFGKQMQSAAYKYYVRKMQFTLSDIGAPDTLIGRRKPS